MTSILDSEVVRRYFGDDGDPWVALRILKAMTEPIKDGEKVLQCIDMGREWIERIWHEDDDAFRPYILRLPQRFQPQVTEKKDAWIEISGLLQSSRTPEKAMKLCDQIETIVCKQLLARESQPAPRAEPCSCPNTDHEFCNKCHKPHDAVEEKIKEITKMSWVPFEDVENKLRELVRLARL